MRITSAIKEKLSEAKEEAKEKVNPFSQTNKYKRMENREHQQEIRKAEHEAYQKEEIHQAAERGKRQVQNQYNPQHSVRAKASRFAEGTSRAGTKRITQGIPRYKGANDFRIAGGDLATTFGLTAPRPKKTTISNVRVTTISKAGTVKITEPIEKPKQKEPDELFWDLTGNHKKQNNIFL